MIVIYLFWLLLLIACSFAFGYGGRDGRWAALLVVSAAVLTTLAQFQDRLWRETNYSVMLADLVIWLAFVEFMFRSRRYFPVWMAAAQTNAVLTHVATLVAAVFQHQIYAGFATIWSLPCLFCMVVGVALDRNAELQRVKIKAA